ncbi:MAG: hypothetical protein ACT4SY_13600 [Hyphomicrobiales bacterium]
MELALGWICAVAVGIFSWEAVTALGTWAAVVVVWCQLSSVGQQVKLQAAQIKLQNYADYTKRYQEIILHFPESINMPTFQLTKLRRKEDRDQTMRYMRAYFDLCFEEWDLNNRSLIDKETWKVWKSGIEFAFSKSAFKQARQTIQVDSKFGKEFEEFVMAAMSKSSTN